MLHKCGVRVYQRVEEAVASSSQLQWHHFDAGVVKVGRAPSPGVAHAAHSAVRAAVRALAGRCGLCCCCSDREAPWPVRARPSVSPQRRFATTLAVAPQVLAELAKLSEEDVFEELEVGTGALTGARAWVMAGVKGLLLLLPPPLLLPPLLALLCSLPPLQIFPIPSQPHHPTTRP